MACAGHCLGAAMATVSRMPHFAPCANAQRCTPGVASAGHLVFSLQQVVSLPVAFGSKGAAGVASVWKSRSGDVVTTGRPGLQRMIVMATQDAGTSTLVVQEVEFFWKGPGSKVLLSGDFVNWESQLPLEKTGSEGWFVVKQKLAPGTYKYKYIVDGEWQHSPDYPMVSDNAGGFNNEITVAEDKSSPQATSKESNAGSSKAEAVVESSAQAKGAEAKPSAEAKPKPSAAASPPKPKVAAAGGAKKAKAVAKPLLETMVEDVVPRLTDYFQKERGVSDVEIQFADNQLQGSFIKNQVPYNFWAYFPDGKLEGSRGFSLTSHGSPPSTVEPFLIDENKITGEAVVQQVIKRLFAQKLLSTN
ncbi:hypothetical protein KC19_6G099100 [Ceratodon purpureus]|uniref:AMP-activated protein kinase glycogen-binding domain-containing protein n=1 Tax=Ceratodon purpureus TaxID=3225 RepID=A0A8T0HIM0_CERPU|nr:hypothetical protein KC19_6G099100 [Ceratodon purpureus]